MDLIQNYGSDVSDASSHSDNDEPLPQPVLKKMHIDVAPSVSDAKIVMTEFENVISSRTIWMLPKMPKPHSNIILL